MAYQLYDYQIDLISRARAKIAEGSNVMIVSPPGSGKSVVISEIARLATEKGGHVLFLVHRKELIEQITNSFKTNNVDMSNADLYTVVKAKNRLEQLKKPSLIITDEGHHGKASTYQAIYDYFDDVPRLGFTATPWRMNGTGFTTIYDEMVEGKTVDWLIKNHKLANYRYFSLPAIDTKKLKVRNGEFTNDSIDDAFGDAIYGDVVQEYLKHSPSKQAILYAHSVEASIEFASEFQNAGINAVHADAKTPKTERESIMQDFRNGEIKVLCNVDLISEGFDVPDCAVTILCRPTKSLVLYLQQSMRSMRYKPNKTATIIDCVMNYNIHGLPDDKHDWSKYFTGGWKRRAKANTIRAKECPECSSVWSINTQICINCGYDFGERERKEKERIEAELVEIQRRDFQMAMIARKPYNESLFAIEDNWKIAQAKTAIKGSGNPLYKIAYFYIKNNLDSPYVLEEIINITNKNPKEVHQAFQWMKHKIRN